MADLTLGITGEVSPTGLGSVTATRDRALTGLQLTGNRGNVGVSRPFALEGFALAGQLGGLGAPLGGEARLAWPRLQVAVTGLPGILGDVALTLALPDLAIAVEGRDGALVSAELELPAPTLAVTGRVGVVGNVSLVLPVPQLTALGPNSAALTLPGFTLQATGRLGLMGDVRLTLPNLSLAIAGQQQGLAGAVLSLPVLRLAVAGTTGTAARVDMTLRALALAASGHTGLLGQVVVQLPVVRLDASGYQAGIGTVQLVLPALQLQATARTAAVAAGSARTLVMQTEREALTEYSHFPFNSFATFGGLYLAASDDGVFALTGADDAGVPIDAVARVGITDFGTSHLKRVDKIYVGYRADGDLILRVTVDDLFARDYRVRAQRGGGVRGNHTQLGKGVQARYWQFEVRNQNGGDFKLDTVEVKPMPLRRRIGASDA